MSQKKKTPNSSKTATKVKAPKTQVMPKKKKKRCFTVEYKLRILQEADACIEPNEVGALLRREGLYYSHLSNWRKLRSEGTLAALSGQKRGPKPLPPEIQSELEQLRKEKSRLEQRLARAETIIEVQKKVSTLLGIELPTNQTNEEL